MITGKERRKRTNLKPADFSLSNDFENNGVSTSDSDFSVKSESEDILDASVSCLLVVGANIAANSRMVHYKKKEPGSKDHRA